MAKYPKVINIHVTSELEAATVRTCLQTLSNNLTIDSLLILADKSSKPGIGEKLKSFKNLI